MRPKIGAAAGECMNRHLLIAGTDARTLTSLDDAMHRAERNPRAGADCAAQD